MQDILAQASEAALRGERKSIIRDFIYAWDGGDMDTVLDISHKAMIEDEDLADILDDIKTAFCECIHAEDPDEATDEDEMRVHAKAKVLLKQYMEERKSE